jgi:peroxisomal 2,4-dienoyl-CoA reductase
VNRPELTGCPPPENKVVFCTGGAGSICSAQVRALVRLGADACIIGRNAARTEAAAAEMRALRGGARVLGIGGVDVRRYGDLERAVARCVDELGGLDFVMCVRPSPPPFETFAGGGSWTIASGDG